MLLDEDSIQLKTQTGESKSLEWGKKQAEDQEETNLHLAIVGVIIVTSGDLAFISSVLQGLTLALEWGRHLLEPVS